MMGISETEGKEFCKMAPRAILGQISLGRGGHAMYGTCLAVTQALLQDLGGGEEEGKVDTCLTVTTVDSAPFYRGRKGGGRVSGALNP